MTQISMLLMMVCLLFSGMTAYAVDPALPESGCTPSMAQSPESSGVCGNQGDAPAPTVPEGSLQLLLTPQYGQKSGNELRQSTDSKEPIPKSTQNRIIIHFFRGEGCPHCEEEKRFLDALKRSSPQLEIREYEVWYNRENAGMMAAMLRKYGMKPTGVPVTIIGDRTFSGFTDQTKGEIAQAISDCENVPCGEPPVPPGKPGHTEPPTPPTPPTPPAPFTSASTAVAGGGKAGTSVTIPIVGALDPQKSSLPLLTLVIAGMDSFNPCAFFVLLTLLGLLVHAESRGRMLLIGSIFVFFSGFIYFLFMAAWLNLFMVMGHVATITTIAGTVSVLIAAINIKDFFLFRRGVSLTIPDSAKPKLFDRMRRLLRSTSLVSIVIAATALAVLANLYELLCTAGFPMIFTRILTLNNLPAATYYLYLVLYNIIYVIPLFIIVLGFTATLGKRQLSEWQGRVLKLASGLMMLGLGATLLVNPALLNSVTVSFTILAAALAVSLLTAAVTRRYGGGQ